MTSRKFFPWSLTFLLLGALAIGAVVWSMWRAEQVVTALPDVIGARVLSAVRVITNQQPTITVNERVFVERSRDALQLVVSERETSVEREVRSTQFYSSNQLRVRSGFIVKAGFDLAEPFAVEIKGDRVILQLPPARILSVESTGYEIERKDGLWNRVSDEEISAEISAITRSAREKMIELGMLAEAESTFIRQLGERLGGDILIETRPYDHAH